MAVISSTTWRWAAAGTAAAAVVAVLLVVETCGGPWERLAARLDEPLYGLLEGRLAVAPTHSTFQRISLQSVRLRGDVRTLAAETLRSDVGEHQKAVAALVLGNLAEAEQRLTHLATTQPSAAVWNDLGVTLTEKGAVDGISLFAALGAIDRANDLDAAQPACRYNRGVILQRLGLHRQAAEAFSDYLRFDVRSGWAAAARNRIRALEAGRSERAAENWQTAIRSLSSAIAVRDAQPIIGATKVFRQDARTWAEGIYLAEWAAAFSRSDAATAEARLWLSRTIGQTLYATNGEALLRDAVAAIDDAMGDSRRLTVLAAAHEEYRKGRELYATRQLAAAASHLNKARALFEEGNSPMSYLAAYFGANASIDSGERKQALTSLLGITAHTPPDYKALHAQIQWSRGTIAQFDGAVGESLTLFGGALAGFAALGELPNTFELRSRLASSLTSVGRTADAWHIHRESIAEAARDGNARRLQSVVWSAAWDAVNEQQWRVGHALLGIVAEIRDGNPVIAAEAAVWRVVAADRAGMTRLVPVELFDARHAVEAIGDTTLRDAEHNVLRLVEGMLLSRDTPADAAARFTDFLTEANRLRRTQRVPDVLVARAAVLRRLGRDNDAERDLRRAIDMIEASRNTVERDVIRDSFIDKAGTAYTALSDLLDRRGNIEGALAAADGRRARIIVERAGRGHTAFSLSRMVAALPPRAAMISYGVFPDRLAIYVITAKGASRFESSSVSADALERSVSRLLSAIGRGDNGATRREGQRLYDALLASAKAATAGVDSLIIVADKPLDRLPWSALVQTDGRFLVEDYTLTVAPGIQAFSDAKQARRQVSRAVVSIGNPSFDSVRYATLPRLDAAEREARDVASMYPKSTLLVGSNATKAHTITALQHADVVHLATHALLDDTESQNARLLLAASDVDEDDSLTATEIADMRLSSVETVVLAGCRTASVTKGYGYVQSLATAFIAAGTGNVIASLWDVADDVTREFSVALHHSLRNGQSTEEAVRTAQLSMLRSGRARLRAPSGWASMQLFGVGR
jgi:CHAT domain-containing protein